MMRLANTAIVVVAATFASSDARADTIGDQARARVAATLPAELGVIDVALPPSLEGSVVGSDQLSVRWKQPPRVGTLSVEFAITSPDGRRRSYWGRVKIGERVAIVTATKKLKAGQIIAEGDLRPVVATVGRGQGWRIDPQALRGSPVLRDVDAGARLEASDVQAPPPLRRGHPLTLEIRRGRLRVATRAVLERRARPGEDCSVRLTTTRRLVRARLLSADKAILTSEPK